MSLVGIGIDLVAIERVSDLLANHRDRFLARCFRNFATDSSVVDPAEVAGLWAAKEAFLKALGADVRGIPYRDIEISRSGPRSGRITPHGAAALVVAGAQVGRIHLTIGRDGGFAIASVILEK